MYRVLYHSHDLDGKCSGAIVKKYLLEKGIEDNEIDMIPFDYGYKFPYDKINKTDTIYIVDISVNPFNEMVEILEKYNIVWVDHHKTVLDKVNLNHVKYTGKLSTEESACELCWKYFFKNEPSTLIKLLGTYDIFKNAGDDFWNEIVSPFQYGMRSYSNDCSTNYKFWEIILNQNEEDEDKFIKNTIKIGNGILSYIKKENNSICNRNSFEAKFHGLNAICCNTNMHSSLFFSSLQNLNDYDIMLAYEYNNSNKIKVSLFTTKDYIDVSKLAGKYGGGGHKKAGGFMTDNLVLK